ncbi:MAG TPA: hypothetical protein IGS53_13460 [Leptolyngbyaceae cyanobacterium M33_DOE_097]|nr:hypothetical protein [Leptolyngbyaceae cyanobacterium M33_DOE_097]
MLRHPIPQAYLWILLWFIVALVLLMAEAILIPQPILTMASQAKEALATFLIQAF